MIKKKYHDKNFIFWQVKIHKTNIFLILKPESIKYLSVTYKSYNWLLYLKIFINDYDMFSLCFVVNILLIIVKYYLKITGFG